MNSVFGAWNLPPVFQLEPSKLQEAGRSQKLKISFVWLREFLSASVRVMRV